MSEIVRYTPPNVDDTLRLGKVLAESGFFADARQAAQAVAKILAGREMGFGEITAMTGIHVINGRVAVGANLMAADLKAMPGKTITLSSTKNPNASGIHNPSPAWDGKSYVVAWDIPIRRRQNHLVPRSYDVVFLRRISRDGEPQGENVAVAGQRTGRLQ